jgi:putative urate catabolism protein
VSPDEYARDLIGYGAHPSPIRWPGNARIALSVVVNWEEGAENSPLHGDRASEVEGSDVIGAEPYESRHLRVESMFEYGTRAGMWRLARILDERNIPATVFASGMAVERYPAMARELAEMGHEICAHGYRWIDYHDVDESIEREHIDRTIRAITEATGSRPVGWYTGRNSINTRALLVAEGGFLYDSDSYADDLPYWDSSFEPPHLVVPYAFDTNDMRFVSTAGFSTGRDFFDYLKDTFDQLHAEGSTAPKLMSVGLHIRIAGRPGRAKAFSDFLAYASSFDDVWFARRRDIAEFWAATYPTTAPLASTVEHGP